MSVESFMAAEWGRRYRTAFVITGSAAEAEDAVQDALAVVVETAPRIRRHDHHESVGSSQLSGAPTP